MKYPKTKPVKKAFYGAAIMAGTSIATSLIQGDKAKQAQEKAEREAYALDYKKARKEQQGYDETFAQNNVYDLPVYAKGGEITNPTTSSTTGKLDAKGGVLVPISANAEVVTGNTHKENKIDNSYGVTLSNNGNPIANVEDKEVVVDNDLVFSNKLKTNGESFAEHAKTLNIKIGKLQSDLKGTTKPNEKFALERTIKGLEKQNENLFRQQELVKSNTVGDKQEMVNVENGTVPKGARGLKLSDPTTKKEEDPLKGIGDSKNSFASDFVPLVADNIANFILTNNTPKVAKPIARRPIIIDTRVNANPQLAEVTNSVNTNNNIISNNTNSSSVARALMTNNNIKGAEVKAGILTQKQGAERQLQNEQNKFKTENENVNADLTDQYNADVVDRTMAKNAAYSKNVSNLVEDVGAVQKVQAQRAGDQSLINFSLADDPTGEKTATYKRLGQSMSPEQKAILLANIKRQKAINASKK